jgi:ectoine hydroxylase-related dioxygenase (phytanoyl-CoA dioxygenase family)
MNDIERYEFDRLGYLVIPQLISVDEAKSLAAAVDEVEEHALKNLQAEPRKQSPWWDANYHRSPERGYHAQGEKARGKTLIIEDFWNASPAFDFLINHPKTMSYITPIIQERPTINNSEIRIRYPENATGAHMGGPISHKYRYAFTNGKIDCMMVRMVYFLHDVAPNEGPFSVVPGTHKSNFNMPYPKSSPDDEPGMIGLPMRTGDAILFTEHLRHGGLINRSEKTRKTLHVGYGPGWMLSQNIATGDEPQYVTEETRKRLTLEQNNLLRSNMVKLAS